MELEGGGWHGCMVAEQIKPDRAYVFPGLAGLVELVGLVGQNCCRSPCFILFPSLLFFLCSLNPIASAFLCSVSSAFHPISRPC